jgi:hypothetical protein
MPSSGIRQSYQITWLLAVILLTNLLRKSQSNIVYLVDGGWISEAIGNSLVALFAVF